MNMIDPVLQEDFDYISDNCAALSQLNGCNVLVTGATGVVGSLIVKTLAYCNVKRDLHIGILLFARGADKAREIFGSILDEPNVRLFIGDINNEIIMDMPVGYIIHGANPTASKFFVTNPVETIMTTLTGTNNILKFATQKNVKGMVYLSSMEVYGQIPDNKKLVSEEELGHLDILAPRSSYSESKRAAECLCVSYASE